VVSVASPLLHLANYLGLLYHIIQSKGNNRINNNDKSRINQIDEEIQSLKKYLNFEGQLPSSPDGSYIPSLKNRINKLKTLIRKKERSESEKAMVISTKTKTRREGIEITKALKEQINKFHDCHYCNRPLGLNPHCDHIHPVTHGGLSTLSNMVYICSSCNLKKKDLTLREYLLETGLDRDKVENKLLIMGKRI